MVAVLHFGQVGLAVPVLPEGQPNQTTKQSANKHCGMCCNCSQLAHTLQKFSIAAAAAAATASADADGNHAC